MNGWELYGILVAGILLIVIGLTLAAMLVGWWGMRKARREGRCCPDCGRWDEPVDILIHRIYEHERE